MDPIMESLVPELAGKAQLGRIVSDLQPDLAARFGVQAFPTFMIFRDGQPIARRLGATSRAKMREWIESALAA
jgi:thioredoxin 1